MASHLYVTVHLDDDMPTAVEEAGGGDWLIRLGDPVDGVDIVGERTVLVDICRATLVALLNGEARPGPATAEGRRGVDPNCRYQVRNDTTIPHVCTNNTGAPVQPGQRCWYEARAQMDAEREGVAV